MKRIISVLLFAAILMTELNIQSISAFAAQTEKDIGGIPTVNDTLLDKEQIEEQELQDSHGEEGDESETEVEDVDTNPLNETENEDQYDNSDNQVQIPEHVSDEEKNTPEIEAEDVETDALSETGIIETTENNNELSEDTEGLEEPDKIEENIAGGSVDKQIQTLEGSAEEEKEAFSIQIAGNFTHVILFAELSNDREIIGEEDIQKYLDIFDGDEEHQNAMKPYFERISGGQLQMDNIFPQYDGVEAVPYVLDGMDGDYLENEGIIRAAVAQLAENGKVSEDYDQDGDGLWDYLTIVLPGTGEYVWGNTGLEDIGIGRYQIVYADTLLTEYNEPETLLRNVLKSFGYPDIQIEGEETDAVIPLAFFRDVISGWMDIPEVTEDQVGYTLYETPDDNSQSQAVILRSPNSDTEFFVVEYGYPLKLDAQSGDKPDIFVYRICKIGEEEGGNIQWSAFVFEPSDIYGNADLKAGISDGALVYADGSNSGITIDNINNIGEGEVSFDILLTQPEIRVSLPIQSRMLVQNDQFSAVYEGIDYSPVFDPQYYLNSYQDLKKAFGNDEEKAFSHFLETGMSEGRQGSELFNVITYKNRYPDLRAAFGNDLRQYYLHYLNSGITEGRSGEGTSSLEAPVTIYEGVDYSSVYNYEYYLNSYTDLKNIFEGDDIGALQHFVQSGMSEGRRGNPSFNVYTYKNRYGDLRRAFGNDLRQYYLHYLTCGIVEGRSGEGTSAVNDPITTYEGVDYSPVYDFYYYVANYTDIKNAFGDDDMSVLQHFVQSGMSEGRRGNASFNVFSYRDKYADLRNAFGSDLRQYYLHYLSCGINEGRDGSGDTEGERLEFYQGTLLRQTECVTVSYNGSNLTIAIRTNRDSNLETLEGTYGIVMLNSSGTDLLDWSEGTVAKSGDLTVSASFTSGDSFRTAAMGKYAIAVKNGSSIVVISDARYLSNPDIFASKEESFKDKYMGYYEGYKITSKKGIQGVSMSYTEDLRVQHILLNVDIADMVSTSPAAGYVSYVYKGQTYYFQDLIALKDTIYDLHGWGSTDGNAYGENHTRAVTLNLLLSWDDSLSYLIHPSARSKGASYYTLNMAEERARNTFEALFCYMGEELGEYKERVTNWTLGNEVNSCRSWNYSGSMSLEECVENYAEAFQLLYQGVKRTAGSSRIFISLDHCWTAVDAGHSGKDYLDAFASYMNKTAPSMQWNVNYHPYSQPLSRNDFWNDYSNTTDSADTRYISMRNIRVLTDYLGTLETQYGKESGSIRVIIGELGFSAAGGNSGQENEQAAALGYGYYKAMFNTRIDAYIIRAYLDDPEETSAGLHLGLRRNDGSQTAKISYDVYQNLDTDQSLNYMNQYLGLIGIGSWESAISGFDASELPASDF